MPLKIKPLSCAWVTLCAALLMVIALPQQAAAADADDPPGRVARLSYLSGAVSFQPAGESDWVTATINRPMTTGDKLWADADSRAELHIGSAAIRLNGNTGFSFLNLDDRTVQIQLSAGTLNIRVRRLARDQVFEVDTPNQAFSILRPGRYRLEASEDGISTIVTVMDGEGEATGGDRTYTIESGRKASLSGTDTLSADIYKFDRRERDDFDDWSAERDRREERSHSVRYVSPEMVGYEDLDESGVWRRDPEYGEVWVPTAIPVGWAPYHYGHWAWIAPWGWTWVDDAAWGYAPFHYGRWAYARGSWCWIPGPISAAPVYAPALVAFVGGPRFGVGVVVGGVAVGWFPLGPREVYVPAYRVSPDYVTRVNVSNTNVNRTTVTNVYNTTVVNNNTTVVNNVTYVNRTAPGGVTAVSSTAFTSSQPVAASAVRMNQTQIASATVVSRAEVAPTQNSVTGPSDRRPGRAVPPGLAYRPVVARATPPPPPVSFERQQQALAAHPGQPLAHNEVETLRPANVRHSLVRQPSPNQPEANPNRGAGQVAGTPGAPNRQPVTPPNFPGNGGGNRFPSNGAANRPENNPSLGVPPRNDRPQLTRRPDNRPAAGEAPNAQPIYRPTRAEPPNGQPNNRPEQQNRLEQPVNNSNPAPSNNRPPSQDNRPNERPSINSQPRNAPAPEPSTQRPSSTQPIYRPLSPDNRPNPGPPANDRPISNQPRNAPALEPSNGRPSVNSQPQNPPYAQPNNRRIEPPTAPVSRPANPPPPENRSVAPSPQPSGNSRAVPAPAPTPAPPARPNSPPPGNKRDRDNDKRN